MGRFRQWFVENMAQPGVAPSGPPTKIGDEKGKQVAEIFRKALQALGQDKKDKEDAGIEPLSKLRYPGHGDGSDPKGRHAALKLLDNAPGGSVFNLLINTDIPELVQGAKEAQNWLNKPDYKPTANDTVGSLLKMMFGKRYEPIMNSKSPSPEDDAKAQVQPQPPKPSVGPDMQQPEIPPPEQPPEVPPMAQGPGQPQAAPGPVPPTPGAPLPPRPAGAEMGLF